ncbi:rab effector MyRIP [Ctenodactylus gundi]
MGRKLDLSGLTDRETEHVLQVVQRDFSLRKKEEERLSEMKQRLAEEGSKCRVLARHRRFVEACCMRCCAPFTFLLNPRRRCGDCKFNVCKSCCAFHKREKAWVCGVCQQARLLRTQSLEWFYSNVKSRFKRFGSAKVLENLYRKHRLESGFGVLGGGCFESNPENEGSVSGSDSTFYRQPEGHSMMDTLAVALRVAEEAIEEAISKAEAHGDSLDKQSEACYLRGHKEELTEELATAILQKIMRKQKSKSEPQVEGAPCWPQPPSCRGKDQRQGSAASPGGPASPAALHGLASPRVQLVATGETGDEELGPDGVLARGGGSSDQRSRGGGGLPRMAGFHGEQGASTIARSPRRVHKGLKRCSMGFSQLHQVDTISPALALPPQLTSEPASAAHKGHTAQITHERKFSRHRESQLLHTLCVVGSGSLAWLQRGCAGPWVPAQERSQSAFSFQAEDALKASPPEAASWARGQHAREESTLPGWRSTDGLDGAGPRVTRPAQGTDMATFRQEPARVLQSPDGNWVALKEGAVPPARLLARSKSGAFQALEVASSVASAYEEMGSDSEEDLDWSDAVSKLCLQPQGPPGSPSPLPAQAHPEATCSDSETSSAGSSRDAGRRARLSWLQKRPPGGPLSQGVHPQVELDENFNPPAAHGETSDSSEPEEAPQAADRRARRWRRPWRGSEEPSRERACPRARVQDPHLHQSEPRPVQVPGALPSFLRAVHGFPGSTHPQPGAERCLRMTVAQAVLSGNPRDGRKPPPAGLHALIRVSVVVETPSTSVWLRADPVLPAAAPVPAGQAPGRAHAWEAHLPRHRTWQQSLALQTERPYGPPVSEASSCSTASALTRNLPGHLLPRVLGSRYSPAVCSVPYVTVRFPQVSGDLAETDACSEVQPSQTGPEATEDTLKTRLYELALKMSERETSSGEDPESERRAEHGKPQGGPGAEDSQQGLRDELKKKYSAVSLCNISTEVLKVINATEELIESARPWDFPPVPPDTGKGTFPLGTDPVRLDEQLTSLEENVYLAAGTVYGLESQLAELEDAARSVHSGSEDTELAELEDQVAAAAAQVHHAELQISDIESRISALTLAGLNIAPCIRFARRQEQKQRSQVQTIDTSRQQRRKLPAPPVPAEKADPSSVTAAKTFNRNFAVRSPSTSRPQGRRSRATAAVSVRPACRGASLRLPGGPTAGV